MNRRDSILALLAMAAASRPLPLRAQQPARRPYRIAMVPDFQPAWAASVLKIFAETLRESGRIEGRDYVIYRSGVYYGPDTMPAVERALEAQPDLIIRGMRDAAGPLGLDLRIFEMAKPEQIDDALEWVVAQGVEALVLTGGPSIQPHRQKMMQFAVAQRLPTIIDGDWHRTEPRPLLAYGARYDILMRQAAAYVNRILWEGAKPGDLPIQLPAMFKFTVSLKTAKAIGVAVPQALLLRADEVIE